MSLLLSLESVSFRYPLADEPVLNDVTLAVEPGDRLLVLGPSGSGKSTLLALAAGLVPELVPGIVSGSVRRDTDSLAIVLQNPRAQMIAPTVREELAFGLENRGLPVHTIEERIQEVARSFGIRHLLDQLPANLSGGECQRVSLASAIAMGPDLLLLDEPTAYLDPPATRHFFADLQRVRPETTVILVEHRVRLAREVTNRVVRVTEDGRLEELSGSDVLQRFWFPLQTLHREHRSTKAPSSEPVLEISGLQHEYAPGTPVLNAVDLDVPEGQIVGIIGPNGSGKSTLLDRIARLLPGPAGTVNVLGADVVRQKDEELYEKLIVLPQNPEHFFLYETVEQELGPHTRGDMSRLLNQFRVRVPLSRSPYQLSEGQKRRLTFACAYEEARPLLLMDEPEYGLDTEALATLVESIKRLREQGVTILLATHAPELVAAVADRIVMLSGGRVVFDDGLEAFLASDDELIEQFKPPQEVRP